MATGGNFAKIRWVTMETIKFQVNEKSYSLAYSGFELSTPKLYKNDCMPTFNMKCLLLSY